MDDLPYETLPYASAPPTAPSVPAVLHVLPVMEAPTPDADAPQTGAPALEAPAEVAPAPAAGAHGLGDPAFSGPKPPLYVPHPAAAVSARRDVDASVVPDVVLDGATHGPLTVRAASVRGDAHRYHAEPRQDSLVVARLGGADPSGLLLLGVADGVGSAPRSHLGSRMVCRDIVRFLDEYAEELSECLRTGNEKALTSMVSSAVGRVAAELERAAAGAGHQPADWATTLRVVLVPLDPLVRGRVLFTVGDGGTARLRGGVWEHDVVGRADDSGAAGIIDTRTAALPSTRHAEVDLFTALPGDLLVLCTDGLSTPLEGDEEMRRFLGRAWGADAPGLADFLWQLQYRVKSYDDDRTAVCLWEANA
ncbi:PP2C family serine/threonine-protein phosphatase [Streptomyces sp. NBC_00091]|uniref:PP2C family serine/threonine-protein phosphatase n=1 Tax=Streptomyces sp. NBC_00091 TaxID=2975648 RepID=UPI00225491BB|nr:PP2C family serine/threonine-protein phosphatase [Streptomyces sp. NBC_00091]MCX5377981.1 protein phosphatase 2C domain-containing protein [Streptomyces sp. NBC_00091]